MDQEQKSTSGDAASVGPLRVAVLVKQVPAAESLELGANGRLRRDGFEHEMNAYCRRAVAKGTELARDRGGTCTVFTMGPPDAEDVLREAVAWGADSGVHLCDPAFAGSDTLVTARALAAALAREGPFDLVLAGRNSLDGDTGQVGPALAELVGMVFAGGVRRLVPRGGSRLELRLELDDGWQEVELGLPAVLSVAERLCDPCKVPPEGRREVPASRLRRLTAADLGPGPWGEAGSPTRVGVVRPVPRHREGRVLGGDLVTQVAEAVRVLDARGALAGGPEAPAGPPRPLSPPGPAPRAAEASIGLAEPPVVGVVLEPGRDQVAWELLGAAARLAAGVAGRVVALGPVGVEDSTGPTSVDDPVAVAGLLGADELISLQGSAAAEDLAAAVASWATEHAPWGLLAPSTAYGREVAARVAARLGAGLVGDAVGLEVVGGRLVAAKPACAGASVADVTSTSAVQMVTVRPGVLPLPEPGQRRARQRVLEVGRLGRIHVLGEGRDDDVEVLARAQAVIGVGAGVAPGEYPRLSALASLLGAELAATRKVTDRGWAPRSRQVGLTGRSIAPRLYVGLGLSGKFNHMVGVQGAGTVLAVNTDAQAPVFIHADVGIVGDWREVVPLLEEALRERTGPAAQHPPDDVDRPPAIGHAARPDAGVTDEGRQCERPGGADIRMNEGTQAAASSPAVHGAGGGRA